MKIRTYETLDALKQPAIKSRFGKNFESLVGAGSWVISGFRYGKSRCGCCGRPICRILVLKNQSHDAVSKDNPRYLFKEEVDVGLICGPRVFTESCVGFYEDPTREWERQWRAWKDYINYVILCVQAKDLWEKFPEELRVIVDKFLEDGYKQKEHSGSWWLLRDAKKRFLNTKRLGEFSQVRAMWWASQSLIYGIKKLGLVPQTWELTPDMTLYKNA